MTDDPIPAATVLLLRDEPAFEVLMIKRHDDVGFAGGAMVFPGGRVDPGDRDPAWIDHADGLDPALAASQIAAIREAFEETGVLLARPRGAGAPVDPDRAEALSPWRREVEADDAKFLDLIRREDLVLAADALTLFAHWVAPPGLHRRFDTLFFAARCPPGQRALEDGNEATETLWTRPADAVEARRRGTRKIIFPTVRNLELLGCSRSCDEVFEAARKRPIAPIQPEPATIDGVACLTIPDGQGYPVTAEPLETATRF